MIIRRIKYLFTQIVNRFSRKAGNLKINWGYMIFSIFCVISILLLGVNIFRIIQKGYQRYEIIQEEKTRLEALIEKNKALEEDLKYYSSMEYVDVKAREELNLVFPDQRLVYIEKDFQFEESENDEKIEMKPHWRLWYDLLF